MFLPEKEDHYHISLEGSIEDLAFQMYLGEIYPEWQPSELFLMQHWAQLQLSNGQQVQSAFKEKLLVQPHISCNVKVNKSLIIILISHIYFS